jgi:hypothetical protein
VAPKQTTVDNRLKLMLSQHLLPKPHRRRSREHLRRWMEQQRCVAGSDPFVMLLLLVTTRMYYCLKNNPAKNISPCIVDCMVRFCKTWLLEIDSDRRTPLHNALLVLLLPLKETTARSKSKVQHAAYVVEKLLSGPGCNALQIKDAAGNLPIHIATTLGAQYSVLEVSFDIFSCLFVYLVLSLFNALELRNALII